MMLLKFSSWWPALHLSFIFLQECWLKSEDKLWTQQLGNRDLHLSNNFKKFGMRNISSWSGNKWAESGLISFRIYWNLSQETKIPQLCSLTEGESIFLAFDVVYKLKDIFLDIKVTIHFEIRKYVKSYSFSNVICLWSPLWKSLLQHLSLVHWLKTELKTEYAGCVLESAILYVYYWTSVFP